MIFYYLYNKKPKFDNFCCNFTEIKPKYITKYNNTKINHENTFNFTCAYL